MQERMLTNASGAEETPYVEEFRALGQILERDAELIMARWFERASEEQVHSAAGQREVAKVELLEMLVSLGQQLYMQSNHAMETAGQIARDHGEQRFEIGWNIVDLVQDYEILHRVALEHLGKVLEARLTYRQATMLVTIFDGAIAQAVKAYSAKTKGQLEQQVERQERQLRQLTLDLTEAEARERQRIAARLHDDLQQILVAIQMRLRASARDASTDGELDDTIGLVDRAIRSTRDLTADLYPRVLERQSLPESLEWLGETMNHWYGLTVAVELEVARDRQLGSRPLHRLVFDAVRELLFNVVKHAGTDEARVSVWCDDEGAWRIEVSDRGVGSSTMRQMSTPPNGRFGLSSVRQRIEHVGGRMDVLSEPGAGMRVVLTVPVDRG